MTRRRLLSGCALVVVASFVAAACSSDTVPLPTSSSSGTAEPASSTPGQDATSLPTDSVEGSHTDVTTPPVLEPPFPTLTLDETFVDASRPTGATADAPALPSRTLVTKVLYPDAPGPFPLIILAHGLVGSADKLTRLGTAWATAGYVVALPTFPLTSDADPDVIAHEDDVANQPADVSFIIDQLTALVADDSSPMYGRIDLSRIGIAGHSLGATTVYGVVFDDCCIDPRIGAAMIMSGTVEVSPGTTDYSRPLPVMTLHGDSDTELDIAEDLGIYAQLAGPKFFVTLIGGEHTTGFENADSPYNALVEATTTDFWNQYLSAVPGALDALRRDANVEGLSTLQTDQ